MTQRRHARFRRLRESGVLRVVGLLRVRRSEEDEHRQHSEIRGLLSKSNKDIADESEAE